jgi:hypothetical protein
MNPTVKADWLKALSSGEYKKTSGQLHNGETDGYCCLGVLCDIFHKQTGEGAWGRHRTIFSHGLEMSTVSAPESVLEWAGVSHQESNDLANINDTSPTFHRVIAYIETMMTQDIPQSEVVL